MDLDQLAERLASISMNTLCEDEDGTSYTVLDAIRQELEPVKTELDRLQAFVDQLPKDAEGNVYLPQALEGKGFYHPDHLDPIPRRFTELRWDSDRWCVCGCGWVLPLSETYSTREAAEAAKEKSL